MAVPLPLCPGLEGGHEAFGQAHGEAGGFGPGLPVDLAKLGEVEGGEVPVEEGSVVRGGTVFITADLTGVHEIGR